MPQKKPTKKNKFKLFNFEKEGKGVEPNAPIGNPFKHFWELYYRKLNKLTLLNIIYFFCVFPLISFLIINIFLLPQAEDQIQNMFNDPHPWLAIYGGFSYLFQNTATSILGYVLMIVSILAFGPLNCGYTYCLRAVVREEHFWFNDFFKRAWKNVKQGMVLGVLDIIIISGLILYYSMDSGDNTIFIMKCMATIIFAVYLVMRPYMYTMAIMFKLSIVQIIKNAYMFVIIGAKNNIASIVCSALLLTLLLFVIPLSYVVIPLGVFSITGLISMYNIYPVIVKKMVK